MDALSAALKAAQRGHLVLEIIAPNGDVYRFAERDIQVEDTGGPRLFKCALTSSLSVATNFDFRTPSYAVSKVNVAIRNDGRLQDVDLDGSRASVYLWAEGLTWTEIEAAGLLFSGAFSMDSWDRSILSATLTDDTFDGLGEIPGVIISADTWPDHRVEGGAGSVAGLAAPLVLGDFRRGVPLVCVDTVNFKYLAALGLPESTDADYNSVIEAVYDKDGAAIGAANFSLAVGPDGEGNVCAVFTFIADQAASEPLSCSLKGLADRSGKFAKTAGDLVSHPADLVHYLLANFSRLTPDKIDVGALKTLRSALTGVNFGAVVNEASTVRDVSARFLSQCSAALVARSGKVGAVGLFPDATVRKAIDSATQSIARSASFARTPLDMLANDITVKYAYNPLQKAYEGVLTRGKKENAEADKSQFRHGKKSLVLECPDARDADTAATLADRFLTLNAGRHDLLDITLPIWEGATLLEGDAAEITIPEGPSADGAGWNAEKMILVSRTITGTGVRLKFWRAA
ncbi:MAG: hypothetical protein HZB23_15545 [Deltaproteobacteria bacterium]|nr:hypothetical protein [Deltaproteobacteria bacterium]